MKIAALVPYHTDFCAGQRFRIELWARHLRERGIEVEYLPFANPQLTSVLYRSGQKLQKSHWMIRSYIEQLHRVLTASRPDAVYIYREAALIGPALIEKLAKRWRVPVIYDIDEPLFVPYVSPRNGRLNALKFFSKVDELMQMSDQVMTVNKAIGDYAARFNDQVSIVPMAVDTLRYRPLEQAANDSAPPRVAWVGTLTNQPNVELIAQPMKRLHESRGAVLRVIADEPMTLPDVEVEFIKWSYDAEVPRLQECQIGIVPVKPSVWSPWKFFFKLIQYMSLGLPVVATPTGSNKEIIEDGVNGFLANSDEEWYERLRALADDAELRRTIGEAARKTVEEHFSLAGQLDFVENLFLNAPSSLSLKS